MSHRYCGIFGQILLKFRILYTHRTAPPIDGSYEGTESKRSQIVKPEPSTELLRCAHTS
jgi:hypothetical protein